MRPAFVAILGAFGGLMIASPAFSGPSSTSSVDDKDKMICKHEKRTNSRFTRKVCMTRVEREAIAERAKRDAQEVMNAPRINPGLGGG